MKTNQIMKRPLANFTVEQRTKDGMFCATALLKQWNEQDGVVQRKLDNYFASSKTAEFIDTIVKRENLDTPKMVYVKSRASRGNGAGTWMHPLLFIDFAMWINPSFKYDVLKFVYDKMLVYRKLLEKRRRCSRISKKEVSKEILLEKSLLIYKFKF